ncbi:hypothetical protein D9757_002270 [Collybiopsis confluens]|uniref:Uncharacterized protein n=1 Tax=Collybiopsis confluens TaxID=2823264 RepID=A0A8H5HZY4_9AGAR|nr:hypothetical protein D9757_002270 [Collybiopsis confluens]
MVPGLSSLLDELANSLNAYVYAVIAPWLTPILSQATSVLGEGSKAVIASDDQYEVFDDPHASDPSHSLLSKDHFGLILNEPAGKIAQIVVVYSTELIVKAWFDDSNPIDQILEAFHHPYFADRRSSIQHRMFEEMERWIGGLGPDEASQTIQALTKESVREGKNKRLGDGGEGQVESGYGGSTSLSLGSGNYGGNRTEQYVNEAVRVASSYSRNEGIQEQPQYGASSQRNEEYGNDQPQGYGRTQYESTNSSRGDSYGRSEGYSGRQQTYSGQSGYSDRNPNRYDEEPRRSRRGREEQDNSSYGPKTDSRSESENAHGSRREENAYQYQSGGYKPDPEPYERQGDYDYGREQGGYRQEDRGGTGYGGDRPHGGRRHDFSEERYGSGQGGQYESRGSEYQDQSYGRREAGYVEEDYSRGESQEYKENRETGYEGDQYHY